ncbi:hypothetical protein ACIA8I_13975 [Streptomyces rishiriensis]|uniref:hypothetical protein n=1 Tax=Streptomyces rishiriensis TaxID=68264 RepID=UPI0037BC446C
MSHPAPYPVRLADEITRQLVQLADHLSQLPPPQAAQVIARVLDPDAGVLGGLTHLVATGSVFAKDQAERGALPAEVWLALGRASNELHPRQQTKPATTPANVGPAQPAARR